MNGELATDFHKSVYGVLESPKLPHTLNLSRRTCWSWDHVEAFVVSAPR